MARLREKHNTDSPATASASLDDFYEFVEQDRLRQLRKRFESVVFDPSETDPIAIDVYLNRLFSGEESSKLCLSSRRESNLESR